MRSPIILNQLKGINMKKSLLAATILASFAGAASAATSVTMYGLLDVNYGTASASNIAGATYETNSGIKYVGHKFVSGGAYTVDGDRIVTKSVYGQRPKLDSSNVTYDANGNVVTKTRKSIGGGLIQNDGGLDQSRIGIRGSEDLGNGLSAIFEVEGRFNLDNGSGRGTGLHHSYVGLKGAFGEVTIGKRATAADDFIGMDGIAKELGTQFSEVWNNSLSYRYSKGFSAAGGSTLSVGADVTTRENANKYETAYGKYSGTQIGGVEGSGKKGSAQADIAVKYSFLNNKAAVAAAFQHDAAHKQSYGVGLSYDFGMVTTYGRYTRSEQSIIGGSINANGDDSAFNQKVKGQDWSVGADLRFTARDTLGLAYSQQRSNNKFGSYDVTTPTDSTLDSNSEIKATLISAVYTHDLSKRTALYAMASYGKEKSSFKEIESKSGVVDSTLETPSFTSGKYRGVGVGVRHKF